jgi:Xaa-Pro aminopeptidase
MTISSEELNRRYNAIRELMKRDGLESLLISGRHDHTGRGNIRYITNYGIIFGDQYCVFPREGIPLLIGPKAPSVKIRRIGCMAEVRETTNPIEQVKKELSCLDKGNKIGIVGITDISVPMYLAVQSQFGDRLVDATWIFEELRLVKSLEEIGKMRMSALIADKTFNRIKNMIRPNLSDYEIYGEAERIIHEMGCEYSMEIIDAEVAKMNLFYPTGDRLKANGTLALEIAPSFEGYYTELTAVLPVGEYPPQIHKMILVWKQALEAAESILRPGVRVSEVWQSITEIIHQAGYSSPLGYGHGIGLDLGEFWYLNESNTMILKSGTTLALHPNLFLNSAAEGNGIGMGYTYLITDNGNERLNRFDIYDVS